MKYGKLIYTIISWLLVIILLAIIFSLSAQDAEESKELSDSLVARIIVWINLYIDGETLRKIAHMLEFTAFSFCLNNAIFATCEKKKVSLISSFLLAVAVIVSDEIHQIFVPGRAFQFSDLLIDGLGAIIGIISYQILCKIFLIFKERGNKNGSIKTL